MDLRGLLPAAGLVLAAGAAVAQPQDPPIRPGYWEARNKVGFPVMEESSTRQCITADKVAKMLSGPSNRHYTCTYSRAVIGDGKVSAAGDCVDRYGLGATISVDGTYTPTSFRLDARVNVMLAGLPIPISASTEATRIADDCPADAPK